MLAAPSIRDTRKGIELVFDNHGGGALRMVAMALNVSMPTSVRCCLSVWCVERACVSERESVWELVVHVPMPTSMRQRP